MSTENRKCENCEYYEQRQGHQDGICRIRAPQVVTGINVKGEGRPETGWPVVGTNDWCGEFAQKFVEEPQISSTKELVHKMGDDLSGPGYALSKKHQEQ